MNPSIRKYLLINLLLGVTIIVLLTAIVNYYLAQHDIEHHLDNILSQSAFAIQAIITDNYAHHDMKKIQHNVDQIPTRIKKLLHTHQPRHHYDYQNTFEFQIWDKDNKLVLRSNNAPVKPLSAFNPGYNVRIIDHRPWRTFTLREPINDLKIVVAEQFNSRHALGRHITNDYLITILFAYPLLGLLIWGIVGRGLGSLKRVTHEVSHRAPNFLEPVDVKSVPFEIKPLVDELNQLFLRLQQAFEREKRFASDAAHELRTPLAALKTHAQVALRSYNSNNDKSALERVIVGTDRCTHIVEQLLTLSRLVPEANTLEDISEVNLYRVITEVMSNIAPMALEKHIDIELNSPNNRYMVEGNATALGILTRNLIDNAIRYTPEGGFIKVDLLEDSKTVTLRVQDNGPGIPPELRARVFERFYRVLGNKSPGSGLGLAIVQQIATLHQAAVTLSAPQSGTGLIVDVTFQKYSD